MPVEDGKSMHKGPIRHAGVLPGNQIAETYPIRDAAPVHPYSKVPLFPGTLAHGALQDFPAAHFAVGAARPSRSGPGSESITRNHREE